MFEFLLPPTGDSPAAGGSSVGVAFTDRHGGHTPGALGSLNLGRLDADTPDNVAANFTEVASAIGVQHFAGLDQVHGNDVVVVDFRTRARLVSAAPLGAAADQPDLPQADGVATDLPGLALVIRVADCVPVLFADAARGVIGAAHAGRAGWLSGVVPNTIEQMRRLGAQHIQAWVGPHICGRCYEVPEQLADQVAAQFPHAVTRTSWGTPSLDLASGVAAQLLQQGIEQITWANPCTREHNQLHSHRRDGAAAGRLAGLIWLG